MAHKKAAGSVKNGRDSISKRLGVKVFGSESINSGEVIVRQRGTKFHPGTGVKRTSDDTLIATVDGVVAFIKKSVLAFNGNLKKRTFVEVVEAPAAKPAKKNAAESKVAKASPAKATKGTKLDHVESELPKKKTTKKAAPKTATKTAAKKTTKSATAKKSTAKKPAAKKPSAKKTTSKSTK